MRKKTAYMLIALMVLVLLLFAASAPAQEQEPEPTLPLGAYPFYVVDGFGGVHAFQGALPLYGLPYLGVDFYKDIKVIRTKCTPGSPPTLKEVDAVVLDAYGGLWFVSEDPDQLVQRVWNSPNFGFDVARGFDFFIHPDLAFHRTCRMKE